MPQWHDVNPKSDRPSGQALGSALPLFHLKRRSAGTARLPNRADGRPTSLVWVGHDDPDHTCPLSVNNDRVRRQARFQAVLVRSMALSTTTSLRMHAVSASLAGLPARRRRRWKLAITGLLPRAAATAAMYRQARKAARPAQIVRRPRILPLSRLNGATPTRAAACRRVREPSSGSSASSVRALIGPTPGTERSSASLARQTALSRTAVPRSRSIAASASSSQ